MNKDTINTIVRQRRSVYPKDFIEGEKIEDQVISNILKNATWAPTHKLTQPWYFRVYKDAGVLAFFAKQAEIYKEITSEQNFNQKKLDKFQLKAKQVSHVIAVIAKHHSDNKIPEIEEVVATSCALQNIYLSLNAYGIAGYLSTGNICYSEQMENFLKLQSGDKCLGFFQLGIPKPELKMNNRKRIPFNERMEWVTE